MKKLKPRLNKIFEMIPINSNVIDVGADRGLLGKQLLLTNKVNFLQLVENKKGPFMALSNYLSDYCNDERLLLSLSDGLEKMDSRVNLIVMSGLGGETISSIIMKEPHKLDSVDNLILSAHTKVFMVRETMFKLGFYITREEVVEESNKLYLITRFSRGNKPYSDYDIVYGCLDDDPDSLKKKYLEEHKRGIDKELNKRRKQS